MSCKPIECSICHGHFAACQMKDGKCAACRAKEQELKNKEKEVSKEKK